MHLALVGHIVTLATLSTLLSGLALNQNEFTVPLEVHLTVDQNSLDVGEYNRATLALNNISPYTLTNVSARLLGATSTIVGSTGLTDKLGPYSNAKAEYVLRSQEAGSINIVFAVEYLWREPKTGLTYQRIDIISSEQIQVGERFSFEWPSYIVPLVIGFVFGQLGAWLTDWRRRLTEGKDRREQAKGVTLAILQAARKGIDQKEKVSFSLWEDAVVKGNLYPSLHQFGRTVGMPELSEHIAELSILISDYNSRRDDNTLTEDFALDLIDELTNLINVLQGINK